jgi:heme-degrading monooxygenase HmoA
VSLADPFEKARVVVLFRSQLTDAAGDDYRAMAAAMLERAQGMPGFVAFRSYQSEDGERLSLIGWEDHETLAAWREDAEHRGAQKLGRERWYAWFRLEVCDRVRVTGFERPA